MKRLCSAIALLLLAIMTGCATPYSARDGLPTATLELTDAVYYGGGSTEYQGGGSTEYQVLNDAESCQVVAFIQKPRPGPRFDVKIEAGKPFLLRARFRRSNGLWECASTIRFQPEADETYRASLGVWSDRSFRRSCSQLVGKVQWVGVRGSSSNTVKEPFDFVCATPPPSDRKSDEELFALAVERVDLAAIGGLLQRGVSPDTPLINKQERYGTALHFAAATGNHDLAELLLDNGADIQRRRSGAYTPLHTAIGEGQIGVAKLLIDRGADVDADMFWLGGPLHYAVVHGQPEIAELLIEHGADINRQNKATGRAPLHYVDSRTKIARIYTTRHEAVVQILLKAKPDLSLKDNDGRTVKEALDARPAPKNIRHPMDELIRKLNNPKQEH